MSDLRTDLERLGERAAPKTDAFERLEFRRRRRERNRRIAAGLLALVLFVGGSVAAFSAFRDTDAPTPGGGSDEFFALWPDQTADGLAEAQAAVDAGDPDLAWRTDPIEVARRFATEKLLWPETSVDLEFGEGADPDEAVARSSVPPGASCDQFVTEAECPTSPTTVTLRRSGGSGGVWNVVRAHGADLDLPLVAGDVVSSGTWITVPTSLPEGEKMSMGIQFLTACDRQGFDDNVAVTDGQLELYVSAVPEGCTGYVYAMAPPTGVGAVAIGSFLFSDAEATPAIDYLVQEIAAVPVRFVNDTPTEVAEFACDGTGSIAPTDSAVIAQPDGVHVGVTASGDLPVSFSVGDLGGDGAEPGERTETVWQLAPGESAISCSVESPEFGGVASAASLNVVDPNGYFVPAELSCASVVGQIPEYGEGARGFAGDPVQVVRDHVSGLEFDDTVERALYPESELPVVRVVRDGDVVARTTLRDDGRGGWLVDTLENCDGTLFGWREGIAGVTGPPTEPGEVFVALCTPKELDNSINVHDGSDLHVDGSDIEFDTRCLRAPGAEPITILFSNLDQGVQRNISLYVVTGCLADAVQQEAPPACPPETLELPVFRGEIIEGVSEIVYEPGVLGPGVYYFQDDVHPAANGLLFVT